MTLKMIEGEIEFKRLELDESPDHLLTVLDHDNMEIIDSRLYTSEDLDRDGMGWERLCERVDNDHSRYASWKNGEWKYETLQAVCTIKTQLTNRSWIKNKIVIDPIGKLEGRDDTAVSRYQMEAALNMFETLRTLGFLKMQIISAMPKSFQPLFRREISKIKYQNERIYQ